MSDNAATVIYAALFFSFLLLMFGGGSVLTHLRKMRELQIEKIREERKLLETQKNNSADLRKSE